MLIPPSSRRAGRSIIATSALVTLAFWYMGHVWRLFLLLVAGMIASVMLVCSLPLFSQVNATASIHASLHNNGLDSSSYAQAHTREISSQEIALGGQKMAQNYQQIAGTFFHTPPDRLIQSSDMPLFQNNQRVLLQFLQLHGYDINRIGPRLHRLEGRLPRPSNDGLEIVLTQSNAETLQATIGSTFTIFATTISPQDIRTGAPISIPIKLTVVGIYQDVSFLDPFWHTDVLTSYTDLQTETIYNRAIVSDHELLALFDKLSQEHNNLPIGFSSGTTDIFWYFPLDIAAVTQNNITLLDRQLVEISTKATADINNPFYIFGLQIKNNDLQSGLQAAQVQSTVSQVPVLTLLVLMVGLLLFFVNFVVEQLVSRQAETIALSRSRGATLRQILLIFVTQSLLLGLATLLVTPVLIVPAVHLLLLILFPVTDQSALNALPANLWQTMQALGWYLLVAVVIAVLTMCLAVWRTLRGSTLGRGSAPTTATQRPLWQRFYLDLALLALGGLTCWFESYMTSTSVIDARLRIMLAGPCMLAGAALLFLGGVLLVLRAFPLLLRLAARLLARQRGMVPSFSLVMMARMPRQSLRTVLLLIFTIAFMLFSLVFMATQTRRAVDLATYAAGADFSGPLPDMGTYMADSSRAQAVAALYNRIPGVLAATAAYEDDFAFNKFDVTLKILAVNDPQSFVSTVIWSQEDDPQTIAPLAKSLVAQRAAYAQALPRVSLPPLPVIIDATTKNQLHLSIGKTFQMNAVGASTALSLVVAGEVNTIPGTGNISTSRGKVLVDYQSFFYAYRATLEPHAILSPNYIWLHTQQTASALATLRRTLTSSPLKLNPLNDRQAILQALQHDPLYLNLLCTLTLGVTLALLLAWTGNLIAAWQYVHTRLRALATLRALGVTSRQLITLVGWEQSIVCATAIVLGGLGGLFFITLALSSLVFSGNAQIESISSTFTSDIFLLQFTPPLHIVIPPILIVASGAVVALCIVTVVIISVMAARLSLAQMLRLGEDYVEEAPLFVAQAPEPEPAREQEAPPVAGRAQPGAYRLSEQRTGLIGGTTLTPLRRSWGYLLLIEIGIVLAILLSCVVPLFSQVAGTAGLREVLLRPENRYISTNASFFAMPAENLRPLIEDTTHNFNQLLLDQAGRYFHDQPMITLENVSIPASEEEAANPTTSRLNFHGVSEKDLPALGSIVQGHLPGSNSTMLQIALTPEAASFLHVKVGDVLKQQFNTPLTIQVVGLFRPTARPELFKPIPYNDQNPRIGSVTALVSNEGLVQSIDTFALTHPSPSLLINGLIIWRYAIDSTFVTSNQLDDIVTTFSNLHYSGSSSLHLNSARHIVGIAISPLTLPLNPLKQYQQSMFVSTIPIATTSVLILGLILLFLALMAELLVEREASTIAILRSRGATRRQIFSAFLGRTLLLNGLGLPCGLLLVLPTVTLLTRLTLHTNDQGALNLVNSRPLPVLLSLWLYALGGVVVTLAALGLALYLATGMDYLARRREETRTTRRPLWQRFYLDVAGIVVALAVYELLQYLFNTDVLDPQVNVLVKAPVVLATSVCLVLGCMLLFLRLFPLLLRLGTMLATRNKGVAPMLALSQMARAPQRTVRIALLLILTTAFVVFASVFSSSQSQHITEMAAYWTGADFSGSLTSPIPGDQAAALRARYARIPGVTSVTTGSTYTLPGAVSESDTTNIIAVDLQSFVHTVIWPEVSTPQQQNSLVREFYSVKPYSPFSDPAFGLALPAIVDTNTWNALNLQKGQGFDVAGMHFIAVDKVNHIPTTDASAQPTDTTTLLNSNNGAATSGMLVDYQAFERALKLANQGQAGGAAQNNYTNYVWIKTDGQPRSLENVRKALSSGPLKLALFYDLQATIQMLNTAPLTLNLVGILILGALTPLALSWIGCLTASWVHIQQRHLFFGILRALGSTPRQLGRVLLWEQALVYGAAVVMGTLFGLLTALLALPALLLTSTVPGVYAQGADGGIATGVGASTQDLFSLQNILPPHVMLSPSLLAIVGLFALLCALTILLMRRSISRVALAPMLRLNED